MTLGAAERNKKIAEEKEKEERKRKPEESKSKKMKVDMEERRIINVSHNTGDGVQPHKTKEIFSRILERIKEESRNEKVNEWRENDRGRIKGRYQTKRKRTKIKENIEKEEMDPQKKHTTRNGKTIKNTMK